MRISFTNAAGQSIAFDDSTRHMYRVRNVEGFGGSEVDLQLQSAPYQDGATLLDQFFDPRDLSIGIFLLGDREELAAHRRLIARVFNPKLGAGSLHVALSSGDEYVLDCVPDGAPQFVSDGQQGAVYHESTIELIAPNPFWKSADEKIEEMAAYVGGLSFPMSFPFSFAMRGDDAHIENQGDVNAPVLIEFHGPSINPTITNQTTGEFIKIKQSLSENDVLTINTSRTNKYVRVNGDNAMHYIDLDSVFWQLIPGMNVISYEADEGKEDAQVFIHYQNRYVGI